MSELIPVYPIENILARSNSGKSRGRCGACLDKPPEQPALLVAAYRRKTNPPAGMNQRDRALLQMDFFAIRINLFVIQTDRFLICTGIFPIRTAQFPIHTDLFLIRLIRF